eukprot:tig00021217_g19337.t1
MLRLRELTGRLSERRYVSEKLRVDGGWAYQRDLFGHTGCVNAVAFSTNDGSLLASGGDDLRVLIWDVFGPQSPACSPKAFWRGHFSNIFSIVFEADNRHFISAGNDHRVLRHDIERPTPARGQGQYTEFAGHMGAVYRVSVPSDRTDLVLSSSEDGSVRLWDARRPRRPVGALRFVHPMHAVAFHPRDSNLFLTGDASGTLRLWDIRASFPAGGPGHAQALRAYRVERSGQGWRGQQAEVNSCAFDSDGSHFVVGVRWGVPTVFRTDASEPVAALSHPGYRNACTMKSIVWGGPRDEYVLSGSDNFRLHAWRVGPALREAGRRPAPASSSAGPARMRRRRRRRRRRVAGGGGRRRARGAGGAGARPPVEMTSATHVLKGHRSICNNAAHHACLPLVVSSGVEKTVKCWSPYPSVNPEREARAEERPLYTREDYERLCADSDGGEEGETVEEDARTLAMFDMFNLRTGYDEAEELLPSLLRVGAASSSDSGGEGDAEGASGGESASGSGGESGSGEEDGSGGSGRARRRARAEEASPSGRRAGGSRAASSGASPRPGRGGRGGRPERERERRARGDDDYLERLAAFIDARLRGLPPRPPHEPAPPPRPQARPASPWRPLPAAAATRRRP